MNVLRRILMILERKCSKCFGFFQEFTAKKSEIFGGGGRKKHWFAAQNHPWPLVVNQQSFNLCDLSNNFEVSLVFNKEYLKTLRRLKIVDCHRRSKILGLHRTLNFLVPPTRTAIAQSRFGNLTFCLRTQINWNQNNDCLEPWWKGKRCFALMLPSAMQMPSHASSGYRQAMPCHPCHLGLSSGNAVPSMPSRAMQAIHAIQAIIASEQAMRAMQAIMETSGPEQNEEEILSSHLLRTLLQGCQNF